MTAPKTIEAFWYPGPGNFGDYLTKYMIPELFGVNLQFSRNFGNPLFFGVGSLYSCTQQCTTPTMWGSGFLAAKDVDIVCPNVEILSVRGPATREVLVEHGIECPEIYGDPAMMLPMIYDPEVEKKYEHGFFPHYVDYDKVNGWYGERDDTVVINAISLDIPGTIEQIKSCEKIISSSLHGVITAHAYGVPAVWVQHSRKLQGDGIKFADHYRAVGLDTPTAIDFFEERDFADFAQFDFVCGEPVDCDKIAQAFIDKYGVVEGSGAIYDK